MLVIVMVKRSKGLMSRKTRKLTGKGRSAISGFVKPFNVGDKVIVSQKAYQLGMPALRYLNKYGRVVAKRGASYVVEIQDGNKTKQLISHPIHLKLAN